ncbi:hypothetical protein LTR56_017839 [Elasticomyces elasticus]|nr:hypothetical protein LTR22_025609 [Elasticomyces elasticus]KAK3629826.1 hypothetical protein LTR56_017839 [Elasticomyces elasticus]KAK4917520.1 hypothetical protein LTR49_014606 [Elasticomyces elasticus]KAK5756356.1 hypothetical protein LTS12_013545 [Elasticomyces elasticus]
MADIQDRRIRLLDNPAERKLPKTAKVNPGTVRLDSLYFAKWSNDVFREATTTLDRAPMSFATSSTSIKTRATPVRQSTAKDLRNQNRERAKPELLTLHSSPTSISTPESVLSPALLVHQPVSDDDHIRVELATYQTRIKGDEETWKWYYYESLPSRIGHDACLDLTIRAYLAAAHCKNGTAGVSLRRCYAALAQAIDSLQVALRTGHQEGVSDSVIQSCALLAALEVTKGEHNLLNAAHLEGIVSTLASRARGEASDISRSILNYFSCDAMTASIVKNKPSPLEALDRTHYEPQFIGSIDPIAKLGSLRIELSIRLPRLVALTRAVRQAEEGNLDVRSPAAVERLYDHTLALAEELYHVRDEIAEKALHTDTVCPGTTFFTKKHFTFSSPAAWEAASIYWHMRFCVLRLCLVLVTCKTAGLSDLAEIYPNSEGFELQGNSVFSRSALEAEIIKTGQNLFMTENIDHHYRPKRHRLRAQSFIVLWGALRDLPQIDPDYACNPLQGSADRASILRDRMLEFTVRALKAPSLFFTEADMDEAADIFVGGPIKGSYAKLYGLKRFWGG